MKWFNDAKAFALIAANDGGEDLVAHFSGIQANRFKSLQENREVGFARHLNLAGTSRFQKKCMHRDLFIKSQMPGIRITICIKKPVDPHFSAPPSFTFLTCANVKLRWLREKTLSTSRSNFRSAVQNRSEKFSSGAGISIPFVFWR
ncbi:cold shock domain-containing protein [Paraburkholderia sp. DGU8]|uniref:cold shock domain-containing protein n=1 Tax=Paraburkholderia sp. DGU8 TaxID=3161997 RepID=UPI003467EC0D